jgi:hypothetical protein
MSSGEIRFRQIIEDLTATALEVFYVQPNTVGRGGLTTNSCLNYNSKLQCASSNRGDRLWIKLKDLNPK